MKPLDRGATATLPPRSVISDYTNKVICGDRQHVSAGLPTASIDLVVTDPPYGVRFQDRSGRSIDGDDTLLWLEPAFKQLYRVLKPNSFCVSFYGWHQADLFLHGWRAAGFQPVGHLVAVKHYASSQRFLKRYHEQAYLLAKGHPAEPDTTISDVLDWKYTGNPLHPTQKPLSIILPLVLAFSKPNDLVLDPFAGSGTTALAAKLLGRRYLAIEINQHYCQIAEERLTDRSP